MARKKQRPQPLPPGPVFRGPRPLSMPNEDDVVWQKRCAKRHIAVEAIPPGPVLPGVAEALREATPGCAGHREAARPGGRRVQHLHGAAEQALEVSKPNEDDVVWQRRCAKRHTAVQAIVATSRRGLEALRLAPDPDDRNVNKRAWEHLMMVVRVGMRVPGVVPPPGLDV